MATREIGYINAAGLVVAACTVAFISSRHAISPLTLILLSPFIFIFGALIYIAVDLWATWYLDRAVRRKLDQVCRQAGLDSGATASVTTWPAQIPHRLHSNDDRIKSPSHHHQKRLIAPLVFTSPAAWLVTQTRASFESLATAIRTPLTGSTPEVDAAIDLLFGLIMRDFVLRWYSSISDSPIFPNAVERTIREALASIVSRLGKTDWSEVIVGKLLPMFTTHVDHFRTAEHALKGQDLRTRLTESDELDLFLASRYACETKSGKLHPAVNIASPNSKPAEEVWLSNLIGSLLPHIVPERELESGAVRILIREIVACAILGPIIDMLSDPDFWNRLIDDKAGAAIRDQKMVNQFREALDKQGITLTPTTQTPRSTPTIRRTRRTEEISAKTNTKQFELWSKGIAKCDSLLDARRLRSDVASQIRKTKLTIDDKAPDELVDGVTVTDLQGFVERLQAASRKIDKRITELGGAETISEAPILTSQHDRSTSAPRVTLRDILLQPTSLSYFMEYQERRLRSTRTQFWLLVENLKDPLEDAGNDEETALMRPPSPTTIATARDDIMMIWSTYFSNGLISLEPRQARIIKAFVEQDPIAPVTAQELRRVRHSIFAAQREVFAEMEEEDFPPFAKSALYFKAIADIPTSHPLPPLPISPTFEPSARRVSPVLPKTKSRPRASSNPQTPSISRQAAPSDVHRSASPPPPRSTSPNQPLFISSKPLQMQRTDTAPPKVTLKAAFDNRPNNRRVGSENDLTTNEHDLPRKGSVGSFDSTGIVSGRRRPPANMSDSLEFLMSAPANEREDDSRSPLFDDDSEPEASDMLPRRANGNNAEAGITISDDEYVQVHTIEAIQEALNSILETDARNGGATGSSNPNSTPGSTSGFPSPRPRTASGEGEGQGLPRKPSALQSLTRDTSTGARIPSGSSGKSSLSQATDVSHSEAVAIVSRAKRRVFDDEDDIDDIDLDEDDEDEAEFDLRTLRLAAPGDLQLADEIERLGAQIEKLRNQEAVVGALIRKAELTGIASELKILTKSRDSLRREMRALTFQKGQFESQESENKIVPGRTIVKISGTTIGQAEGQSFQLYLVEVHQLAQDGAFGSGWIVTRRYSEFAILHSTLRDKYVLAKQLEFPGKRLVTSYNDGFIEQRKHGLEKYLQALIRIPAICQSNELRAFLSQQNISLPKLDSDSSKRLVGSFFPGQSLVRSFYRTVTSGIDDMLGTGPSSMMETIIQRLSQQAAELSGLAGSGIQDEDLVGQVIGDSSEASQAARLELGLDEEGLTFFTAPICDLFVVLFQLKEKNNWLRRQAILIILQQVLGGTIERKFRDGIKILLGSDQIVSYIDTLRGALWPGGQLKPKEPPRTSAQKTATRDSANRKLSALMPDVAANLIGRTNARQGARRLFAVLQNRRLNRHLIYSVVDEVVSVLFPELSNLPSRPLPTFSSQARSSAHR